MSPLAVVVMAYLVLVAMLVGSFINLAADRLPRGESIITPRSHCRACGRVLNVLDLVPVVGYLARNGRCASCGAPIGVLSPAVEAACGASMLVAILLLGPGWGALAGAGAVALIGLTAVAGGYARLLPRSESHSG